MFLYYRIYSIVSFTPFLIIVYTLSRGFSSNGIFSLSSQFYSQNGLGSIRFPPIVIMD